MRRRLTLALAWGLGLCGGATVGVAFAVVLDPPFVLALALAAVFALAGCLFVVLVIEGQR